MLTIDERKIIEIFEITDFVKAENLSNRLNISEKTVYRRIKNINKKFFKDLEMNLISSSRGMGFHLNKDVSKIKLSMLLKYDNQEFSMLENVQLELLKHSPKMLSINNLFDEYYLSTSSINREISKIEAIAKSSDLKLLRSNKTISLIGTEENIRNLMMKIYLHKLSENVFLSIDSTVLNNAKDQDFINSLITTIENQLNVSIIDPYRTNIYMYTHVLLSRYRYGNVKNLEQETLHIITVQNKTLATKIENITKRVTSKISEYLSYKLPIFENLNYFNLIISSRFTNNFLISNKELVNNISKEIILKYFKINDVTSTEDIYQLYSNLKNHIGPMIFRNENLIKIENFLAEDIKNTYATTFNKLLYIMKNIEKKYNLNEIPINELAYLTIYIEEYNIKKQSKINVIIMCTSGIGTSNLLKSKVESNFPQIKIIKIMGLKDIVKLKHESENIDLILSSVKFDEICTNIPLLYISPLLNEQDTHNIYEIIEEVKKC